MTPSETQKLANEIAQAAPIPEWDQIDELVEMRHHVTTTTKVKGSFERTLTFAQTVELYKALDAEVKSRETQMKELKEAVQAAVLVSGKDKVKCGDYRVTMVTKQGSKKIVAEKLLAAGVDALVIAKATEIGKSSQYVDIRREKE